MQILGALALGGAVTVTPGADQNDYNPTGFANCAVLRVNGSISCQLTGLVAAMAGHSVTVVNASPDFLLWLANEAPGSSAANRFSLPRRAPALLLPGDAITLFYDGAASRWRVVEWPTSSPSLGVGIALSTGMFSN